MMSRILHVTADYPDPIQLFKTPVIKSFLELTSKEFEHCVISLNRTPPSFGAFASILASKDAAGSIIQQEQPFANGVALAYRAPAHGLFHRAMLERVGELLASRIKAQKQSFDLLVGHKLTIEGIAVAKASQLTGIPYALTIQGNTDRRILQARPDLRPLFRRIFHSASKVCTFTPVARDAVTAMLGGREDGINVVPCPTELDTVVAPVLNQGDILSVFHLKNHAVKNLKGLASAAARLGEQLGERQISIVGGGNDAELAHCKQLYSSIPQISFAGPVERNAMQARMNKACVLVVPSSAETFGLVFVEALFAGLPIIYPKDTAVDGYFDGLPFAQGVDAKSPQAIAAAIERAVREEEAMKVALAQWQCSDQILQFTREAIAQRYAGALHSAVAQ